MSAPPIALAAAALFAGLHAPPSASPAAPVAPAAWSAQTPEKGVERVGDTWTRSAAGYAAVLERLDEAARWKFLVDRTRAAADPFASPRGPGFFTFRLSLENRSTGTLVFDAGGCRLVTKDKTTRYPLDLPTIESAYGVLQQEMPPAYRMVREALFDGTVFLEPGGRTEGLLVFEAVPVRTSEFTVDVPLTTPDGARGGLTAGYRRVKGGRR